MAYLLFADYSRRKGIPSEFRVSRSMLGLHGTPSRRVGDHLSSIHRLTGGSLHDIKSQGRHDVDLGRSKEKVWDPTLTAQRSCPSLRIPQPPYHKSPVSVDILEHGQELSSKWAYGLLRDRDTTVAAVV